MKRTCQARHALEIVETGEVHRCVRDLYHQGYHVCPCGQAWLFWEQLELF